MGQSTTTDNRLDAAARRFISTPAGFYERYVRMLAYYATNEQAYEAAERQYEEIMGERRFTSFSSFKSSYSQFLRRKKRPQK